MKRGDTYLANFGKKYNNEFGKIRPALIIQNDIANRNIDKVAFKGVTVMPLSTNLSSGDVRVEIKKRDHLNKTSEICINELCTFDLSRLDISQKLTLLSDDEMQEVVLKLMRHLDIR